MRRIERELVRDAIRLRQNLHRHPYPSNMEGPTAEKIVNWLEDRDVNVIAKNLGGGHGFLTQVGNGSKRILLRADMDALPTLEKPNTSCSWISGNIGAHHGCGHDGHSAALALGLASMRVPDDVTVYGIFQAAEETGEGAKQALRDDRLSELRINCGVFGSHNIPGEPLGEVLVVEGLTATASSGFCLSVKGIRGHSSRSNTRDTPIPIVCQTALEALKRSNDRTRCAVVGLESDSVNYGVSPERSSLHLTFRSSSMSLVEEAIEHVEQYARSLAKMQSPNLELNSHLIEPFSETVSRCEMCEHVRNAAQAANLSMRNLETNFPWSEDCGLLLDHWSCGGCFFGIGAGMDVPNLHEETYDWPDDLTEKLASVWIALPLVV